MKSEKSYYLCSECGYRNSKWYGRCPSCKEYNTMEEVVEKVRAESKRAGTASFSGSHAVLLNDVTEPSYIRIGSGMTEFDRVLGGGLVSASAVLLSGEPGIGKSTLLMQLCSAVGSFETVLYVSGEESANQLKLRAKRLGVSADKLYVLGAVDLQEVLDEIEEIKPTVVIIDSIQTMSSSNSASSPGSVTQVKECASCLINHAKNGDFSVILVGHVNKEGSIAGPKVLEHMVDVVLYFEGERQHSYRIIRAAKNRFGSTNEIGVFEMTSAGLVEVENPSEAMLKERAVNVPGSCAVCTIEGSRPIITDIQALVTPTVFPVPRRNCNGIDHNRMCLLLAVLEKRLGLKFSLNDVYINVTGGLTLNEPSADLAIALALISGIIDKALPQNFIASGEIGLAGECRSVPFAESRYNEAVRLGFSTVMLPISNAERMQNSKGIISVKNLYAVVSTPSLFLPKNDSEKAEI